MKYSRVDPQQPEPETIFIELTLHKNFKVTVGFVYRPPDSNRAFHSDSLDTLLYVRFAIQNLEFYEKKSGDRGWALS